MTSGKRMRAFFATVIAVGAAVVAAGAPASASAAPSAWWNIVSSVRPGNLAPQGEGDLVVQAVNIGDTTTEGKETINDVLPPGFEVVENEGVPQVSFFVFSFVQGKQDIGPASGLAFLEACKVNGRSVSCSTPNLGAELNLDPVRPFEYLEMIIRIKAEPGAPANSSSTAQISGGGAPTALTIHALPVTEAPTKFGVDRFSMVPEIEGGDVNSRAGSHPAQLTTTLSLNQNADPAQPPGLLRKLHFELPAGFIGNLNAVPRCSALDFQHVVKGGSPNLCPSASAIGAALVTIDEPHNFRLVSFPIPVFNLEPKRGEPARFGFELTKSPVILDTSVRTGGDYGVNVDVSEVTQLASVLSSTVTIWGVPGNPVHNASRGWGCLAGRYWSEESGQPCIPSTDSHPLPFLIMPTSCETSFSPTVEGLSWPTDANPNGVPLEPKTYSLADAFGRERGIVGCNQLPFAPTIETTPEVQSASSPTGLNVRVRMPQEGNENSTGVESSAIRSATVTLPAGLGVNPAAATGLGACSEGEVGFEQIQEDGTARFTPELPTPFCPDAAKIGTVKLRIPVLPSTLEGSVYLATQTANPFGSLVAMYIVAEDPVSGVLVKLAGDVSLGADGQISTSLRNTPQAPIEEAEFNFFGGPHAALGTPPICGSYETTTTFTPWSGNAPANPSSTFAITSGAHGAPCAASRGFAPKLHSGSTSVQAGALTPFVTTIAREDSHQDIGAVELHLPPGLSAMIKSVVPCDEARANAGTCPAQSLIGHSSARVGLGNEPYEVGGGQVFLTGPYRGAPYGLSIVTPAKAGPFDLGNVIVRARLDVDRFTAAVTVTTDQTGLYAIPQVLKGIPVDIKQISVNVDRPGFTFNPTNCQVMAISGALTGGEGASASVSAPFQAANCANLKFAPKFSVSTSGHTSKANGASLSVKLTYPKFVPGAYANIAKVKVDLPKQLPSRLTTLHEACLAATFNANPANCPARSIVGHAKAIVPNLPLPLEGPAYFVSHGGEAFPSLTMVLQGNNVTVELVGTTFINSKGITSSTFKTVPDAPVESFELSLPKGKFSALAANGNLCKSKLAMPTAFTAQNGAERHQSTKIKVTGCPKAHLAKKPKKLHKKKSK